MSIVTRICGRCKVDRPLDDFYVQAEARASARAGKKRKMPCRQCARDYAQKKRAPKQAYVDKVKSESGCVDCGLRPKVLQVLEFDHRSDQEKHFDVSDRMTSGGMESFIAEINKCDIVCANCHRVRTVAKNQFGRAFGGGRVTMAQVFKDQRDGLGHLWSVKDVTDASTVSDAARLQPALF